MKEKLRKRTVADTADTADTADIQGNFICEGLQRAQLAKVTDIQTAVQELVRALGGVPEIRRNFRTYNDLDIALAEIEFPEQLMQRDFPGRNFTVPYGAIPEVQMGHQGYEGATVKDVVREGIVKKVHKALLRAVFPYGERIRAARRSYSYFLSEVP